MDTFKVRSVILCSLAGVLAGACGTMQYDPRNQAKTSASTMSAETAERVIQAALKKSYPVLHRGALLSAVEFTPTQFRVVLFEKGEARETCECVFKFGENLPLRVWQRETSYFVQLFEDKCAIHWHDFSEAKGFAEALGRIETLAATGELKSGGDPFEDFKKIAAEYRAKDPKPVLTEEGHKYQVLAENAFDEKRYADALDYFEQALKIAPWWASGHYNRAQLLAREGNLEDAITEIKMYLELAPDAKDARAARDKMYIWEGKIEKKAGSDVATQNSPAAKKSVISSQK